jgi:hypothetical protein
MADVAFYVNQYGKKELVNANDMKNGDRGKTFRCCGPFLNGSCSTKACNAEMKLVIVDHGNNYFALKNAESHHLHGCCYDETPEAKVIRNTDIYGKGQSVDEVLSRIQRASQPKVRAGGETVIRQKEEEDTDEDESTDYRTVERKVSQASTLKALYTILSNRNLDELYGNQTINNWIVDKRNSNQWAESSLEDGQAAILVCHKMSRDRMPNEIQALMDDNDYMVFPVETASYNAAKRMYVLIRDEEELRIKEEFLFKKERKRIAFLSRWSKHGRIPNVYIPDLLTFSKKCMYIIPPEE